jgi:hypothetical protein
MQCYEVLYVWEDRMASTPGLVWRAMPDRASSSGLLAKGLWRRIEASR